MFKRILTAMKFNPAGREALAQSADLARQNKAELYVVHVLDYRLQGGDSAEGNVTTAAVVIAL